MKRNLQLCNEKTYMRVHPRTLQWKYKDTPQKEVSSYTCTSLPREIRNRVIDQEKIFACSERLAKNWREERLRVYGETENPGLLKISLYDLRA